MDNIEEVRLVYQVARDFYENANSKDYNFNKKTSKTAFAMLENYVKTLKEWHEPEMVTDEMIRTMIRQTVIAMLKVAYFKFD